MWSYRESLEWLYGRQALGIKLGLAKVERLLELLGNPHYAFRAVHVAGTNGKGSVTRMLAETLVRSGFKVGATTSPHLVRFTERIEVGGSPITQQQVASGLWHIRDAVEVLDADGEQATFFEVVTALAFLTFADAGVEWAVVETGMGGRLDATNVLRPAVTVITNVSLDHQQHLGSTVGEIAAEKAGIMKPATPCITAATGDALLVIKAQSHVVRAPMSIVGEDYIVVPDDDLVIVRPKGESHYRIGLAGAHQKENGAVVVATVEALRELGVTVPERAVREALFHATNPGRLESFELDAHDWDAALPPRKVEVLVDGAHNLAAARSLRRHLESSGWEGVDLVCGFCRDKDWRESLAEWLPLASRVWTVPVRNPRTLDGATLAEQARKSAVSATPLPDASTAVTRALAEGATRIVVAGSLFLAGEVRALLRNESLEEIHGTQ